MRVLIVSQYFWPEHFRINDLARGLIERGHEVTVVTGCPNYPKGKIFEGYGFFNRPEIYEGVKVLRIPMIPRGSSSGLRLLLNYLSFALSASVLGPFLCRGHFDSILVCQLSPVTVALPGIVMKIIKRCPLLMWTLDLWPESISAAGGLHSKILLKPVDWLVRFIYKNCSKILYSSRGFEHSMRLRGVKPSKLEYFPNWIEPINQATCPMGVSLPSGFIILFAGNIGVAQDFDTILGAATQLRDVQGLHWVILGDGRQRNWVEDQVQQRNLQANFHLLGRFPAETMSYFFQAADALLVTLKPTPAFSLTVPGKLQSYMACGKPILAALDGEGMRLIQSAEAGITAPAGDPAGLADAALKLFNMTSQDRNALGENGRTFANQHFDRETLFDRLESYLKASADKAQPLLRKQNQ